MPPSSRSTKVLTRKRVPLSCLACRIRKLKCNREKPCQNCIVRGAPVAANCTYAEKTEKVSKSNPRADAEDMRKRINRLESSIRQMMEEKPKEGAPSPVASNGSSHSSHANETLDGTGGQKMSVDTRSTHWDAILNDLGAMKDAWSEENDHVELSTGVLPPLSKTRRPNLLNGLTDLPDRATIISSLPSKDAADRLVAYFFDNYNPSIPAQALVHKPSFLKQYDKHWADPSQTTVLWAGSLFGIMCFSLQWYRRNKQEPPGYHGTSATIMELYRLRTAQCIAVADMTKPVISMLQTFYMYAIIEYADEADGDMGTYLLSGHLVRLALQQGLHRDPSQHQNISVFEGEMRRRLWKSIAQHDLLACVRVGSPRSLRYSESDTMEPRNLYDDELFEEMETLPPSRPLCEPTPMSYSITKGRVMTCYGRVVEFLHQLVSQPYEEVLRLDSDLMEARELVPPRLQFRPIEEMYKDPPSLIMERLLIQQFYHKAICLLHRKYWKSTPPDSERTFFYSRKASIASAMSLLSQQESMHRACRPGGPLVNMKWYDFAITNHDFLLAAMIVCLDLMSIQMFIQNPREKRPHDCMVTEIEKLNAVEQSRVIWSEVIDDCKDAKRALSILNSVLGKLKLKAEGPNTSIPKTAQISLSNSASNLTAESLSFSPFFTSLQISTG
ncbi:Fusarisetin A cluster transcription factor fsa6 [Hyphodiscus hymeniophilus]|uniref:Fusarisetin A cluster transcription factor fsa6 n=1 Tax=Hyphodiscus hymeniophilus TaxID=353542 RepID=A0A9P6VRZ1_9HELO|nr:Fusarisetin A cluster transcription factor fsa6 [Hyphodiscus hymeniophilus]